MRPEGDGEGAEYEEWERKGMGGGTGTMGWRGWRGVGAEAMGQEGSRDREGQMEVPEGRGERAEECDQERERGESPGEEGGGHLGGVAGIARIVYILSTTVVKWMGMAAVRLVWGGVARGGVARGGVARGGVSRDGVSRDGVAWGDG